MQLEDVQLDDTMPDIQDDDIRLSDWPDVAECRILRQEFKRQNYWPNVWVINERGNVTLLAVGWNGAKEVASWV